MNQMIEGLSFFLKKKYSIEMESKYKRMRPNSWLDWYQNPGVAILGHNSKADVKHIFILPDVN